MSLTQQLKSQARALGFTLVGTCPAVTPTGVHRFYEWLERGYAGSMNYLVDRAEAYEHPRSVLPGVRSLLMLGLNYHAESGDESQAAANELDATQHGRVARYAWPARDYHDTIHARLKPLVRWIDEQAPGSNSRGVIDTAPLLERDFAQLAGLGWAGKNTLIIHPRMGSWMFLAAILTDIELEYDEPFTHNHCGRCTACLDACPTDAFPEPYVLDATRCISYLTIEHRDVARESLRREVGDWVFGCDICQEVCPWNRRAPLTNDPDFQPIAALERLSLIRLFELDDATFRALFRRTPMWRSKRHGLLRNAAIALGNLQPSGAVRALKRGLLEDDSSLRAACVWALRKIDSPAAHETLAQHKTTEKDEQVLTEYINDA